MGAVLLEESCAEMDVGVLVANEATMRQINSQHEVDQQLTTG